MTACTSITVLRMHAEVVPIAWPVVAGCNLLLQNDRSARAVLLTQLLCLALRPCVMLILMA